MVELDFGGVVENVITRKEFTFEQARKVLKDEVVATLGCGTLSSGRQVQQSNPYDQKDRISLDRTIPLFN